MKVDPGHFARKILNAHQVYDTTSWDWHVYITFATAFTSLSANQKLALLWLYRAWFNDFARYVVWQKVLFSSDLDPEEWLSDSSVCKSLLQSRSLDLNKLTAKQMARTLFLETAIAGKQLDRGYIHQRHLLHPVWPFQNLSSCHHICRHVERSLKRRAVR